MIKNSRLTTLLFSLSIVWLMPAVTDAQVDEDPGPQPAWVDLSASERSAVLAFAEDYKDFMSVAKTEVSFVIQAVKIARDAGFRELTVGTELKPGGRYYDINRGRSLTLIVPGEKDFADGFRVVGAHIDSPRLELKGRPLYEQEGFALFQTYRHGGIKN